MDTTTKKRKIDEQQELQQLACKHYFNMDNPIQTLNVGIKDKEKKQYKCVGCGSLRTVKNHTGFTNLWSHIRDSHANWREVLEEVKIGNKVVC